MINLREVSQKKKVFILVIIINLYIINIIIKN